MFHVKHDGSVRTKRADHTTQVDSDRSNDNAISVASGRGTRDQRNAGHGTRRERAHFAARALARSILGRLAHAQPVEAMRALPWAAKLRFAAWLELGALRLVRSGPHRLIMANHRSLVLPSPTPDVQTGDLRRELFLAAARQPQTTITRDTALAAAVPMPLPAHHIEVLGGARRCAKEAAPDLVIGFLADPNDHESWITHADVARWNLTVDTLYDAALDNLWRSTQGAVVLQEDVSGREIYHIRHGDGLDCSRLLLAKLWAQVSDTCGDSLILCAPTRGKIYAAPADQPNSIDRLAKHVTGDWQSRADRVSPALWIWQEGALHRWVAHA